MNNKINLFLIIFFVGIQISNAQSDSLKVFTMIDSFGDDLIDTNVFFDVWDTIITSYNGGNNVRVYKKYAKFYKEKYYLQGQIKSKVKLQIVLSIDSIFNDDSQSQDSIPRLIVNYRFSGLENGKYTEYYENGGVMIRGFMCYGVKINKWRFYDESGKLLKIETMKFGRIVKTKYY